MQEQLTRQVADELQRFLNPRGTGVIIEAQHMCMCMRGVMKQGSTTITSSMTGEFRDKLKTREEFLQLVRMKSHVGPS